MSTPYTYLIGWSNHNKWYYGVRYSKTCHPTDLWVTYFTSSKRVKEMRRLLGDPDVIEIRKIFNNSKAAKLWEDRVLSRMKVCNNPKWLNQSNNYSFAGVDKSWNTGLTKENDIRLKTIANKISIKRKEKHWESGKYIRSTEHTIFNRFNQIIKHNPGFKFTTYTDFSAFCNTMFINGYSIEHISKQVAVNRQTVTLSIEYASGIKPNVCQSWTKIKKKNPDIPFESYNELSIYLFTEICVKQRKIWHLHKELNISEDAIKRAIRVLEANHCL